MTLLEAAGISKSFAAVAALTDVSFSVSAGSIAGLIGPNGAGKSTFFNVLSGFDTADAGSVRFDGHDIAGVAPHKIARLGVVRTFQATRPLKGVPVRDNVLTGTHLAGTGRWTDSLIARRSVRANERELADRAQEALEIVGLTQLASAYPGELSAGELRLLEIARALATRPRLLLLDEPAAGLNHSEVLELESALRRVASGGTTLVVIEHDVELVFRLCDNVTVLDFGRVILSGPPADVRGSDAVAEAYFGTINSTEGGSSRG